MGVSKSSVQWWTGEAKALIAGKKSELLRSVGIDTKMFYTYPITQEAVDMIAKRYGVTAEVEQYRKNEQAIDKLRSENSDLRNVINKKASTRVRGYTPGNMENIFENLVHAQNGDVFFGGLLRDANPTLADQYDALCSAENTLPRKIAWATTEGALKETLLSILGTLGINPGE